MAVSGTQTIATIPVQCNIIGTSSGIRYNQSYNCIPANIYNVTTTTISLRSLYSSSNRTMETDVIIIGS